MLRLLTVKQQTLRGWAAAVLPASEYAAMRANAVLAPESGEKGVKEEGGVKAGPKGAPDGARESICRGCAVRAARFNRMGKKKVDWATWART